MIVKFEIIENAVCQFNDLKLSHIYAHTRKREYIVPRQVIQYFADKMTKMTFQAIANRTGMKSHATVKSNIKRIQNIIDTDRQFASDISKIRTLIIEESKKGETWIYYEVYHSGRYIGQYTIEDLELIKDKLIGSADRYKLIEFDSLGHREVKVTDLFNVPYVRQITP